MQKRPSAADLKYFVTMSVAKGLGAGAVPTPDASPLRLPQHDRSYNSEKQPLI